MKINRRGFMATSTGVFTYMTSPAVLAQAGIKDTKPIKIANLLDKTGGLNVYCLQQIAAVAMAVDELNKAGGLLGRKLELIFYDLQSTNDLAARYATQAFVQDKVDMLHGAVTSSAREVIRPIVRRFKGLYFYGATYEGGVCDRRCVCTGMVPTQELEPLVNYVKKNKNAKTHYILAADYNYGQLTTKFLEKLIGEAGGKVLKSEFFPLDATNFAPVIQRLEKAKPDVVWSALVGDAHTGFYRQFQAATGKKDMTLVGCVYTAGRLNVVLSPAEGNGIITAASFYEELKTPEAQNFVKAMHEFMGNSDYIGDYGEYGYRDIMLWATAVKKAGSVNPDKVIEALPGTSFKGPGGLYTIDKTTNHVIQNVYIGIENMQRRYDIVETFDQMRPTFEESVCNLIKDPNSTKQYEAQF